CDSTRDGNCSRFNCSSCSSNYIICLLPIRIISMSALAHELTHDHAHDHHRKETFITKYIFSTDHKMIAKQHLVTGVIMGVIGIAMSLLFRIQIAWPEESFKVFSWL